MSNLGIGSLALVNPYQNSHGILTNAHQGPAAGTMPGHHPIRIDNTQTQPPGALDGRLDPHLPGRNHGNADGYSRRHLDQQGTVWRMRERDSQWFKLDGGAWRKMAKGPAMPPSPLTQLLRGVRSVAATCYEWLPGEVSWTKTEMKQCPTVYVGNPIVGNEPACFIESTIVGVVSDCEPACDDADNNIIYKRVGCMKSNATPDATTSAAAPAETTTTATPSTRTSATTSLRRTTTTTLLSSTATVQTSTLVTSAAQTNATTANPSARLPAKPVERMPAGASAPNWWKSFGYGAATTAGAMLALAGAGAAGYHRWKTAGQTDPAQADSAQQNLLPARTRTGTSMV